jgi:hypothetical protein
MNWHLVVHLIGHNGLRAEFGLSSVLSVSFLARILRRFGGPRIMFIASLTRLRTMDNCALNLEQLHLVNTRLGYNVQT